MNFMGVDTPPFLQDADGTSVQEEYATKDEERKKQRFLAHITQKKAIPPGNINHLLSPSANNKGINPVPPQEVNLNGIVYQQVNMASMTYAISSCHAGSRSSLVD